MTNTETKDNYVTVRIPKKLAGEIDLIMESGTLGYRSRAELVNEAIRRRIEQLNSNNSMKPNNLNKIGKQ
jgi:metal-responsive CopG/Arc/MetJ family transcriptional regulator